MADIFISYGRGDRERVEPLAAALESEGYEVWWDRHIATGGDFGKDIEAALTAAKAVIVCWSAEASESHWVRDEASYARDKHNIVPIQLDDSQPPLGFRQFQAVDFSGWPDDRSGWDELIATIARITGGEAPAAASPAPATAASPTPKKTGLIAAVAVALVAAAGAGWFFTSGGQDDSAEAYAERPAIAVLPFRALTNGADDPYFAEGLTEEITNRLSTLDALLVIASSSAAAFEGEDTPLNEIAEKLGANYIVDGTIRRSGETVRVTARLVDVTTGENLWSSNYDSEFADVLQVQTDISEKVASALDVLLDEDKRQRMAEFGVDNPEAWVEFAKGKELFDRYHAEARYDALDEANVHFERAVELAPNLWLAWLESMDHYGHQLLNHAQGEPEVDEAAAAEAVAQLRDRARRAELAHPDRSAPAAQLIATLASDDWSGLDRILEEYAAADCPPASWANDVATVHGLDDLYEGVVRRRATCDALNGSAWNDLSSLLVVQQKGEEMLAAVEKDIELRGSGAQNEFRRMQALLLLGREDEAWDTISRLDPQFSQYETAQHYLNAATGSERSIIPGNYGDEDPFDNPFLAIWRAAVSGDRETANRMAAEIDGRRGGAFNLLVMGNDCMCGAAFDIDATPNFKRQLAQTSMTWPPADPLDIQRKLRARNDN